MSDIIRLLPDSVANQIAAGEVIQRPASVIKELVENAVDAGATDIRIFIRDAGRTLIQVVDNGKGMTETDARMAFERHATSKIAQADDLFTLHTMGFRGEALPSICAIAQIELKTRTADDQIGTRLVINASKVEMQEPSLCEPGSNIMVKNLFFNVPARRKFLKSDSVETANIMREFERLALVNNNIRLSIDRDGKTLDLRPGSFKQRIADIWKNNINLQLLPVEVDTSLVKISGFVSRPENARRRNALQYLIVNGRNMRHPYFHRAIISCYESLIPADSQPCYFIKFDVDPQTIDVNIHPTKNEIKFENEQPIWQILSAAVRESLGRFNAAPAIDFDVEDAPEIPAFVPDTSATHEVELDDSYNPFAQGSGGARRVSKMSAIADDQEPYSPFAPSGDTADSPSFRTADPSAPRQPQTRRRSSNFQDWEKLYDDFIKKRDDGYASMVESKVNLPEAESELEMESGEVTSATLQLKNSYILTPSRDGLMVIDQHRAHKRILYETYLSKAREHSFVCQNTMFPETVELSAAQNAVLAGIAPELENLGFSISPLGDNTWSIMGIPSILKDANPRDTLLGMIENITDSGEDLATGLQERLAMSMARSSAIKRGQALSAAEMDKLISDLFRLTSPGLTPEGNTVFTIIKLDDISKLLG